MTRLLLFFFSLSTLFAQEQIQGTLQNGLRYYLWEDFSKNASEMSIAVKLPKQCFFLPFEDFFFHERDDLACSCETHIEDNEECVSFVYTVASDPKISLQNVVERLKNFQIPPRLLEEMKEDLEEDLEDFSNKNSPDSQFLQLLCTEGTDFIQDIFSKEDQEICRFYQSLFDPSQMSIALAGPFDAVSMEEEIKAIFEDLPKQDSLFSAKDFDHKKRLGITFRAHGIVDIIFRDSCPSRNSPIQEVSMYIHPLEPSIKAHVLNDLLLLSLQCPQDLFFGEGIQSSSIFVFKGNSSSLTHLDEGTFEQAKKDLKEIYSLYNDNKTAKCAHHFVAGIEEEFNFASFLKALDSLTLEDMNLFIDEIIQSFPSFTLLDWTNLLD